MGMHIQMCFFIDSTQDLIWGSPPLGRVWGSASLFLQGLSTFLLDQPGLSMGLLWDHPLWFEPSHIFLWIATGCTYHTAILTHMKWLSQAESLHVHHFEEIPQTCRNEAYQWHIECRPGDIGHRCYRLDEGCRKEGVVVSCSCQVQSQGNVEGQSENRKVPFTEDGSQSTEQDWTEKRRRRESVSCS